MLHQQGKGPIVILVCSVMVKAVANPQTVGGRGSDVNISSVCASEVRGAKTFDVF